MVVINHGENMTRIHHYNVITVHNYGYVYYNYTLPCNRLQLITTPLFQGVFVNVTAMYNDSATYSLPATVNVVSNAILRMLNQSAGSISTISKPWHYLRPSDRAYLGQIMLCMLLLCCGLTMTPASFALTLVKDRQVRQSVYDN